MFILTVVVMCLYLYPVSLVSRHLTNTYFREHLSVAASKYRNLHYFQCLNIAPMKKAWFMARMEKELWLQWSMSS